MRRFFSAQPIAQSQGVGIVRILVGVALIYHGCEILNHSAMAEYFKWDLYKNNPAAKFLVYGGKLSELLCGILLLLGFLTRIACLMLIAAMCYIAFVIGNGRIWYEDQYPILFAVIGVIFIFTGPGAYSIDKKLFNH